MRCLNSTFLKLLQEITSRKKIANPFCILAKERVFCDSRCGTSWRRGIISFCFSTKFELFVLYQWYYARIFVSQFGSDGKFQRTLLTELFSPGCGFNGLEMIRSDLFVTATPKLVLFSSTSGRSIFRSLEKASCITLSSAGVLSTIQGASIVQYQLVNDKLKKIRSIPAPMYGTSIASMSGGRLLLCAKSFQKCEERCHYLILNEKGEELKKLEIELPHPDAQLGKEIISRCFALHVCVSYLCFFAGPISIDVDADDRSYLLSFFQGKLYVHSKKSKEQRVLFHFFPHVCFTVLKNLSF